MTNLPKMWKSRVKLGVYSSVNLVYIFVQNLCSKFYPLLSTPLSHPFNHFSHPFLNTSSSPVLIKTFPLLHRPYYHYYDLYKYNNK